MVAPEDDKHPPRNFTFMAFGSEGILDGFAVILMHDNAGLCRPRLIESFQGGKPPDELLHTAPPRSLSEN
jgi:hypothetical protein